MEIILYTLPVRIPFPRRERLAAHQCAIEIRVFIEVTDEHMPTTTCQSRVADILCGEFTRKPIVQFPECREGIEHLPVARGIRAASGNDIRAVRSVLVAGVSERLRLIERVVECRAQITRFVGAQDVGVPGKLKEHLVIIAFDVAIARLFCVRYHMSDIIGEFLDQPQCGLLYPPACAEIRTTLYPL
jgi:hypothetical protein